MTAEALVPRMTEICGPGGVVSDPAELRTYECDGLTSHRAAPALAVLPETAEQVAAVVSGCARAGVRSWPAARAPGCPAARCRAPTGC